MEKITQLDADGLRRPPVLGLIDERHRLGGDAGAGQRLGQHGHQGQLAHIVAELDDGHVRRRQLQRGMVLHLAADDGVHPGRDERRRKASRRSFLLKERKDSER